MKRFMSSLLVIILLSFPLVSQAVTDSGDVNGIHWDLDAQGTLTFTGSGAILEPGPWETYSRNVKSIVIGEGITGVAGWVFTMYKSVDTVTLGPDLQYIEDFAFTNLSRLKKCVIQNRKETFNPGCILSEHAIEYVVEEGSAYLLENGFVMTKDRSTIVCSNNQGKVVLPDGPDTIQSFAFAHDKNTTDFRLPATLKRIEAFAFMNCTKLKSIVFPEAFTSLGSAAFHDCPVLSSVYFLNSRMDNSLSEVGQFFAYCSALEHIALPAIRTVPVYCFNNCGKLQKVAFSEGTAKIDAYVLAGCPKLKEVILPASVQSISKDFFDGASRPVFYCHEGSYAEQFLAEQGYQTAPFTSLSGITLSESSITLAKGKTKDLSVTAEPADATFRAVDWCSTDESVATVKNGKVKAVKPGECDIWCLATDDSGLRVSCHVVVE